MKILCLFAVALVAESAGSYRLRRKAPWADDPKLVQQAFDAAGLHKPSLAASYPNYNNYGQYYIQSHLPIPSIRHRRDVTFDRNVGDRGRVFGTLGSNDNGLYGKGGYEHNIFNDGRGKLDASAHGTRVLGPYGDSSHLGGSLNWQNSNAQATLEASKQIHGPNSISAQAGGRWPVGKGELTAGGFYSQTQGFGRDYGGQANLRYPF